MSGSDDRELPNKSVVHPVFGCKGNNRAISKLANNPLIYFFSHRTHDDDDGVEQFPQFIHSRRFSSIAVQLGSSQGR